MTHPSERPKWRGVNHLALVTHDMDSTVRFYHGVLGMRLVATVMAGPIRHYFFEIGPENTVAFFEWQGMSTFSKPAGVPTPERPTHLDHISFNVADEEALLALRDRLQSFGVEVTELVDHHIVRSIYFTDPSGIALEASWWALDATARPEQFTDTRFFNDPDPVPAVRELVERGEVVSTPTTHLVDELVRDPV